MWTKHHYGAQWWKTLMAAALLLGGVAGADVVVDLGTIYIPPGTESPHNVVVQVSGGNLVTDMVGRFQVADGGLRFGGEIAGPKIDEIDFAGSIWEGAPGGFQPTLSVNQVTQVQEVSVSLNNAGESVAAAGILCTLKLNTTGYSGTFDLKLIGTVAGDTSFRSGGQAVPGVLTNGSLVFGTAPATPPSVGIERLGDGSMRILIASEASRSYDIEWSPDLSAGSWTTIPLDLPGTGGIVPWIDIGDAGRPPPASVFKRFYRAIAK